MSWWAASCFGSWGRAAPGGLRANWRTFAEVVRIPSFILLLHTAPTNPGPQRAGGQGFFKVDATIDLLRTGVLVQKSTNGGGLFRLIWGVRSSPLHSLGQQSNFIQLNAGIKRCSGDDALHLGWKKRIRGGCFFRASWQDAPTWRVGGWGCRPGGWLPLPAILSAG